MFDLTKHVCGCTTYMGKCVKKASKVGVSHNSVVVNYEDTIT